MEWEIMPISGGSRFEDPDRFMAGLRAELYLAMASTIESAVEDMKRFTKDKKDIRTQDMINSIDGETFFWGMDVIVGRFGFLNRQELYFALQTSSGFIHVPDGAFIEPSFAMRDAYLIAIETLLGKLNTIL